MAENNNSNHVVTLGGLATFLNKLKNEAFYTRGALDTEFAKYAKKNGDSTESFSASELKLYWNNNPVTIKVQNGKLIFNTYGGTVIELAFNRGGSILTSNDINPDIKADRINMDIFLDGEGNTPTARSFVSDFVISKFGYPVKTQSSQEEMYVETAEESPEFFTIYNMQGAVGTLIYLSASQRSSLAGAQGSVGAVSQLKPGFYLITSSNSSTSSKKCEFLCEPSTYALYYCTSGEGGLGHFLNKDTFQTIAVGGGSGTGDYVEATDDDINGLTY